ncbi:MAG: hypothetical protein IKB25_08135 [Lentisphaeria bacterium]|nr:hypothetical protein [Lentisphaeria bacterium]
MNFQPQIAPHITGIIAELQAAGYEAYLVGGAVRDFLLQRQPKDYDISTSATPEEVKKVFRKNRVMIIGRRFRLVHFYHGNEIIEISTFRKKPEPVSAAERPKKVQDAPENMIFRDNEFGTVQEDAERRDFTVNALFYDPVNDKLFDFTGMGVEDIKNGIVRAIGVPKVRFEEDPVRILRALKLVGQYGFTLEKETAEALQNSIELIKLASESRITLEMEKVLKNPYGEKILEAFHNNGFLKYFMPEIDSHWDHEDMEFIRDILTKRNERIRNGEYRESISLALSVFAYPSAARWIASAKKKTVQTKAFRMEIEDLVSSFFLPQHPTRRAIGAAARTLLLQPEFASNDPKVQDDLKRHPGYAHARELAFIRNSIRPFREDFEEVFPPSHKEYRSHKRNRKRKRT